MTASLAHLLAPLSCWPSDAVLLQRYVDGGDEAAFAALVNRHGSMVLRLCRRILNNADAAEDAFQAAFLILARKAATLKQPDALPSWLHGVARRVALKARSQAKGRFCTPASLDDTLPDARPDPLTQLTTRELLDILDEEVQRLPEGQRSPLVLCCLEGHTQEEAARILGCSPGSIKGRLERGRRRLQARLQRRGIALSTALALVIVSRSQAVPALLLRGTVTAALAGTFDSSAAALAQGVLKGMALTRFAGMTTVLLTLALAASAAVALVYRGPPAETPKANSPAVAKSDEGRPHARTDALGDPLPPRAVARLGSLRLFHGAVNVNKVVLSPDGKLVTSTDDEGANKLWDVASGRELPLAKPLHRAFVFAAHGKLLAAEQRGNRVWDVATGKEVLAKDVDIAAARQRKDHNRSETRSPDGTILAVRGNGGIRLLDARSRKELPSLQGQPFVGCNFGLGWPYFSPDGKFLAVSYGMTSPGLCLWDLTTRKEARRLRLKANELFGPADVAFSADGKIIAATDGGGVTLWDARTGEWLHDRGLAHGVTALAFTPDGKTLLTAGGHDRFLRSWDPFTGRSRGQWKADEEGLLALLVMADGKHVISSSSDGTIRLWDRASGKEMGRFGDGKTTASAIALSPNNKFLATSAGEGIQLWDVATRKKVRSFAGGFVFHLAFSPDGTRLASSCSLDAAVRLWNVANGQELPSLQGASTNVMDYGGALLAFAPDGRMLATGDRNGVVRLWDPLTGKELRRLGQPWSPGSRFHVPGALAFSPDGRAVAVGCTDQTVRLLEVATGKERACLAGHQALIASLAYSPDGRLLASGSWDRTVLTWDVTGRVCPEPPDRITLDERMQERLWDDLAGTDAARAYRAIHRLAASPSSAIPFMCKRLHPAAAVDEKRLARLIADLDSDDFATREKAGNALAKFGAKAVPAYRKALASKPSLEMRRRLDDLLDKAQRAWWDASGERLRSLRAIEALELAGTNEARDVLKTIAAGAEGARLTHEANAALKRLAKSARQ